MASSPISAPLLSTPWLSGVKPNPRAAIRLFCFPYAGGGATIFRTWQSGLPSEVEVCPVQLPGRGRRLTEAAYTNVHTLVQGLAQGLFPFLDKPFAFFGHSMGATISFELARYLRREHHLMPRHLFNSGRRAPHVPGTQAHTYNLPDDEFLATLHDLKGTPREALEQPELMELLDPKEVDQRRDDFELKVIDVYQQPILARDGHIVATPTLVREFPKPVRRLIGDLANTSGLFIGLDLDTKGKTAL